jgi:hypothetical protein
MKKNLEHPKLDFYFRKMGKSLKKVRKILGKHRTTSKRVFKILAHIKIINSSNKQASHQLKLV